MSEALSRPQAIKKISEMIKDIRIAMLSTVVRGYQLLKAAAAKGNAPVGQHQEVVI